MKEISGDECFNVLDQEQYIFFYFGAKWCGPCVKVAPELEKLSKTYDESIIKFYKIDIDNEDNQLISNKCQIKAVPAFLLFKERTFLGRDKGGGIHIPKNLIENIIFKSPEINEQQQINEQKQIDEQQQQIDEQQSSIDERYKSKEEIKDPFIENKRIFNKERLKKNN